MTNEQAIARDARLARVLDLSYGQLHALTPDELERLVRERSVPPEYLKVVVVSKAAKRRANPRRQEKPMKICPHCKSEFQPDRRHPKCCSDICCVAEAWRQYRRGDAYPRPVWTPERFGMLMQLYKCGTSADELAERIGGVTAAQVCHVANKYGLTVAKTKKSAHPNGNSK